MNVSRRRSGLVRAGLLFLLAFLVYNANLRVIASGDSRATRFMPLALLRSGTFALDDFRRHVTGFFQNAYWAREIDGHLVSVYPIVTPLLVTPFYLPAAIYLERAGWQDRPLALAAALSEKLSASLLAAASAGLLYLLLRRRGPERDAVLLSLAYAFATNTWATSSQALWQHGTSQLLLIAALLVATGRRTPGQLALCGACCGLLAANRPPDILLAAAIAVFLLLEVPEKRRLVAFFGPAVLAALPFAAYNVAVFGRLIGGYPFALQSGFFEHPVLSGLAGLLFSPGKGLFVFSPFLLFLFARPFVPAPPEDRRLSLCLAAGAGALLFLLARTDWRGGFCYGPRFLTDLLPIFLWMLVPVLAWLGRGLRIAFLAAVLLSIPQQVIGVLWYPFGRSDFVLDRGLEESWKPENAQFLLELRNSPPLFHRPPADRKP